MITAISGWLGHIEPSTDLSLAEGPDFRHIVGEFAAATRESMDVPSNTSAFMTAVDEALQPSYQVILVKSEDGHYEKLAASGIADVTAFIQAGPRDDEVVIPLRVGDKVICRLLLGPRRPETAGSPAVEYGPSDYGLLDSLGQSLALSVRNAQLFKELAGQERLKRELEIAFDVQMGLLPKVVPTPHGALLAATCNPALEVGGDFYDFVKIDAYRWGLLIGDVSGKGVPAALMMAVSLTLFRALAPGIPSPASTLGRLAKLIHRNRPSNKIFVAAIYLIYDARDGSVLIANAGQPRPLLDGVPLDVKGLPLGINPRVTYGEIRVQLHPASTLVAYSDGLEDLEDEAGVQFGQHRVEAFFRGATHLAPVDAIAALHKELADFAGSALQADDQTMVILQRLEHPGPPLEPTATRSFNTATRL